jgi:hypothetical protein
MENSVNAIRSCVITTIVYAFLVPIFFEMNNALGEREYFVDVDNKDQIMIQHHHHQQLVDAKCKSPCPSSAEMCIAMCA